MLKIKTRNDSLHIGEHVSVNFQRTLRIPDDGGSYPLPPGLGAFPICKVDDYAHRVPEDWREHGGVFIPMYQREALWLSFDCPGWKPHALKVAVGKVNAITGEGWSEELDGEAQDYVVVPDQPWLDGINAGDGYIRQFVAMPLGMGYTVEGQITGEEEFGGIQLMVFAPKPGRFPDEPPRERQVICEDAGKVLSAPSAAMGLGAGGRMRQEIYPDEYGVDTWDPNRFGRVYVHIVNSMMYREITGKEPPPTPVSARTYSRYGLPWFELYDEKKGDVSRSEKLARVKSIKDKDQEHGFGAQQDDESVKISGNQIVELGEDPEAVRDGEW